MLVNKYNPFRRMLYAMYKVFPAARVMKRTSLPFKIAKLRKCVEVRKTQLAASMEEVGRHPLFTDVEIETFNRCNGECGFCPVNRHIDPRTPQRMETSLFHSIIDQLRELGYRGSLYPYSNNEPLLDSRIEDFVAYARERLPDARIMLYSNGLLLTEEKLLRLAPMVNQITINNYTDDFTLAPHIAAIAAMVEADPGLAKKVSVTMRYRQEIMTSRGGQSPNKQDLLMNTLKVGCTLPTRQLVIRPDGKISLCCNDAIGKVTMGDLTRESIADVWWGERYVATRNAILRSREGMPLCRQCDTVTP